ncbi:MAG: Sugar-specific transcriptional regulator TrmB [Promethearchaeota archaeon]|jgi:sugar-specific transcriptional regulator TrmB|nr:MAG: Sugar-specific transcriptional regulator TrmB [Candidatus Lokiarchaeota archaeon]
MSNEIPDNVKESLREIGLTDYEISIYLTLISKGPMDARELSDASGVPYSRIYNILTQLEKDKKWIIKEEESRPSRYFAKSPDEALIIAKKQYNDNFDDHSNLIIHQLTPIYQSHDTPIKIALYIHRGRDVCLNRALSLINLSKTAIYLVSTDFEFLDIFYEDIRKARARGVTDIRLLIEEETLEDQKFSKLLKKYEEIAEIKYRDQLFGTSIIIDEGEDAFIILSQKFFEKQSYFGVVTDHIAFGPAANYYFNYLYETAKLAKFN